MRKICMKEYIRKVLFLFIMSVMLISPSTVFAKEAVNLKIDKTDLEIGDEIAVTASMSGDRDLYALTTKLVYDKDVFAEIDDSDFDIKDETLKIAYNSNNHKIGMINTSGEISKQLFTVHLKVKKNAKVGDTNIGLTNIKISDGENEIKLKKQSVLVLVTRKATENEVLTSPKTNKVEDTKEAVIKTFTTKPVIAIVLVALLLVVAYVVYKKSKHEKVSKFYPLFILILVLIVIALFTVNFSKKDVNKDGYSNYEDAQDILEYLIDMKGTKKDKDESSLVVKNFKYDLNNDGVVSVGDAGHSAFQHTQKVHWDVRLTDRKDTDVYIERGKTVINFDATVKPYEIIKKVRIDDKWYSAIKNGSYYSVEVNTPQKPGVHRFVFDKVILNNNREVDTKLIVTKEVLKEKPYIDKISINEDNNTFNFVLEDKDNAVEKGTYIVRKEDGTEVFRGELEKENSYQFEFDEDVKYNFIVNATWDLDSDELNSTTGQKNHHEREELYNDEFTISKNCILEIGNFNITDAIEKGGKLTITFDSTNNKGYKIDHIIIKGKQYNVTKIDGNHYTVVLEGYDTSKFGRFSINVDEVELENYLMFKRDKDYKANALTYNVLRKAPIVDNINITPNKTDKNLSVAYQFHDEEDTYRKLKAVLVDTMGRTLDEEVIDPSSKQVTLSYGDNTDGRYTVNFVADYNLGTDRHNYENKNIGSKDVLVNDDIRINRTELNLFPEKGQNKYGIIYYLENPEYVKTRTGLNEFATVTINGVEFEGYQINGTISTVVSFKVPNESGIINLKANRIKLRSENYNGYTQKYFSVPTYETQLDVLKDKPAIKNIEITNEDYDAKQATFKFDVASDKGGFESGKIELNGDTKEIHEGENEVKFSDIPQDEVLEVKFHGTYDLDTDTLDKEVDKNYYHNVLIHSIPYALYNADTYENVTLEKVMSAKEENSKYYEKLEDIKLKFNLAGSPQDLNLAVSKIVVKGTEYLVEKGEDGSYYVTLPSYNKSGEKEIAITDIILNNGKKITFDEPIKTTIEVLKDPVKIKGFEYEVKKDSIAINMNLEDVDDSVKVLGKVKDNVKVKVYDEDDKELETIDYNDKITIKREKNILRYYVKVYGNYDRDITRNGDNYYENELLVDEAISVDKKYIELKDITDVSLFTEQNGNTTRLDSIQISKLENNLEDFFIKIEMENMPTVYCKIEDVVQKHGRLFLIADYDYLTQENDEARILKLDFGSVEGDTVISDHHSDTFEEFVQSIENNLSGEIILKNDLDASLYENSLDTVIGGKFTGTIKGNGHTIYNLTKPLFKEIGSATIEDLTIDNAMVSGKGIIAADATKTIINNVHIYNSTIRSSDNEGTGLMFGNTKENIGIEHSSIVNSEVWGGKRTGGFIGRSYGSVSIKNSYINDSVVAGNWDAIGGIIGEISENSTGCVIENVYSKVDLTKEHGGGSKTGIIGYKAGNVYLNNSISMADGNDGFRIHYNGVTADNVYELKESNLKSNASANNIKEIPKDEIDEEFFRNQLKWSSSDGWNLDNATYDNTPILEGEYFGEEEIDVEGYDKSKKTLYDNLQLLMPFFSMEDIVEEASRVPSDNYLSNKKLVHVVPVDAQGNIVTYLTTDNPSKIKKIKLVFEDKSKLTYDVKYDNLYDIVSNYVVSGLKIDYNYNHYVINSDSQLINNITNYVNSFTYSENLDSLTKVDDSRILRANYDDVIKKELREFTLKFLSNSNYTNSIESTLVDDYLEKEVKTKQQLEKLIYIYNYLNRFYGVDIDGMMLNDFILFNSRGFNEELTPMRLAQEFLKNNEVNNTGNEITTANINLSSTNLTYKRILGNYTDLTNISDFLEYMVTEFSDLDTADWYRDHFKGIIREIKVDGREDIKYRLWDHLKEPDNAGKGVSWYNYILPIITLPENAGYIISSPTQYLIGAQRVYISNPDDPIQHEALEKRIDDYTVKIKNYYTTSSKILEDKKYFNDIHTIQIDKRVTKDENGNAGPQNPYSTEEPFSKNFNEVVNMWINQVGYAAATSNGTFILWREYAALDSDYTFGTWSHETAHNMDARLFLKNNGRRFDGGGEDYSDAVFAQRFYNHTVNMNLSKYYDPKENNKEDIASNLTPERIDSKEEIHDFYRKVFETVYIMDYLEGMALLKLSPEEQSKLVVQASYPNESNYPIEEEKENPGDYYLSHKYTVYQTIGKDAVEGMHLDSIDDLYDNRLLMYPSVIYSTHTDNKYGGDGIFNVRWYQPHNDYGRPDSYSLKWLAYEMLGYKGYDEGFIEYMSNINHVPKKFNGHTYPNYKTDLMALRTITGDDAMDFAKYKKMRFAEVESKLKSIQVINVNETFTNFYNALRQDAQNVIKAEQDALKQYPPSEDPAEEKRRQDLRNGIIAEARAYEASSQVRRDVYYNLKNSTDDFRAEVYDDSKQQEVTPFTVPEDLEKVSSLTDNAIMESKDTTPEENITVEEKMGDKNTLEGDIPEHKDSDKDENSDVMPPVVPDLPKDEVLLEENESGNDDKHDDDSSEANGLVPDPDPDPV